MAKTPGKRTLIVKRAQKVDPLDDAPTGTPPTHEVKGCAVVPRTSFERESGWVIVEGRMVVAPYGADVEADDLVQIKGEPQWWEVDGEPGDYEKRSGEGKATILYLKRQGKGGT